MAVLPEATARALQRVHLFPVRHHSPRTSLVLRAFLDARRPKVVLVEGPSDAENCFDVLLDPETVPPVAILGYRTDGQGGSSLYPFASYSPEYVALAWARQHGARAHFIDLSTGQALAYREAEATAAGAEDEAPGEATPVPTPTHDERLTAATGLRSFEEFWEAYFEAPAHEEAGFRAALLAWAGLIRDDNSRVAYHRARDAFMARQVTEVVASGVAPEDVVVVLGAAHAAAFVALDVDPALEARLAPTVPTAVTMIPYSFTRLAEQTGYGAGNRAPRYYQRAHDAGVDFRRATLEVLCEFTDHLRLRGFTASLADTIEAYRLATTLADLRGKSGPGLDEVREASIATLCRGDATHVDGFLWRTVVGHAVGKVAARIGRNSLQQEFWREVEARRLPRTDEPEQFTLKLNDPVQVDTSVLLHRLRLAEVPYAGFVGTSGARVGAKQAPEPAGGYAALSRVREVWSAQWTPSTDMALVERIVDGDSLQQVCERRLSRQLEAAGSTGATAQVLMEAVVALAPGVMARAFEATDRLASTDDDLPSLASACRALSGLVSYGSSRTLSGLGDEVLGPLCARTFERAVLRVRSACTGSDEAVQPAREALKTLHDLAVGQRLVDGGAWFAEAHELVQSYAVHPSCAGLACGLLYLGQRLGEAEVAAVVQQRLSALFAPQAAAGFLAGFFEVNALVLARSRPVVQALDAFLVAIPADRFKDTLPTLRRAFAPLGATERRYLLENLLALRKLSEHAQAAQAVLAEKDKARLQDLGGEVAKLMDDLDDLL